MQCPGTQHCGLSSICEAQPQDDLVFAVLEVFHELWAVAPPTKCPDVRGRRARAFRSSRFVRVCDTGAMIVLEEGDFGEGRFGRPVCPDDHGGRQAGGLSVGADRRCPSGARLRNSHGQRKMRLAGPDEGGQVVANQHGRRFRRTPVAPTCRRGLVRDGMPAFA